MMPKKKPAASTQTLYLVQSPEKWGDKRLFLEGGSELKNVREISFGQDFATSTSIDSPVRQHYPSGRTVIIKLTATRIKIVARKPAARKRRTDWRN